ncbi:hypothetical protein HDU87_001374 [Geranomyces variabilis]|uniref:Uncharacterized protein n=1 Tax=Geranomyces variabilis TaxID=109894 RepID=A0AAD5TN62_9FUNG|nr:hypothetical protein HDU87_001374 [Geranomyces variabilis]
MAGITTAPANGEVIDLTFDDTDDLLVPASKLHLSAPADESNDNNAVASRTRSRRALGSAGATASSSSLPSRTVAPARSDVGSQEHLAALTELRAARADRDAARLIGAVNAAKVEKLSKNEDKKMQRAQVNVTFALKQLEKARHKRWQRRMLPTPHNVRTKISKRKSRQMMPAPGMVRLSNGGKVVDAPPVAGVLSVREAVSLVNRARQRPAQAADLMAIDGPMEDSPEVIVIDDDDDDADEDDDDDDDEAPSGVAVPPVAELADRMDTQPSSEAFAPRPHSSLTSFGAMWDTLPDAVPSSVPTNEMSPGAPVIISLAQAGEPQTPPSADPEFISINEISYDGVTVGKRPKGVKGRGSERFIIFSDDSSALASLGNRKDRPIGWEVISPNFAPSGNLWLAKPGDALTTAAKQPLTFLPPSGNDLLAAPQSYEAPTTSTSTVTIHLLATHPLPSVPPRDNASLATPSSYGALGHLPAAHPLPSEAPRDNASPATPSSYGALGHLPATHPLPSLPRNGSDWLAARGKAAPTTSNSATMKHGHDTALHNLCFGSHSIPRQMPKQQNSCWPFGGPPETWAQPGTEFDPLDDEPYYDPRRGQRVYADPGL